MSLPKEVTTVTGFSKLLALILFVFLPFIGFVIGRNYERTLCEIEYKELSGYSVTTNY